MGSPRLGVSRHYFELDEEVAHKMGAANVRRTVCYSLSGVVLLMWTISGNATNSPIPGSLLRICIRKGEKVMGLYLRTVKEHSLSTILKSVQL